MEHQQHQDQQQPPPQRMKPPENQLAGQNHHPHQPPPPQKCPRCDSSNTKFCYYNNYSLSQPRYFCKACRRYWTHGGTLRNVPVGGGCRKGKRPKPSAPSPSTGGPQSSSPALPSQGLSGPNPGQGLRPLPPVMSSMGNTYYTGGSFLSSLAAMQSLPAMVNQVAAGNLGGGNSQYFPPQQIQVPNEYFSSQQSMSIPSRPLIPWTQNFINRGPSTTTSNVSSGFWSEATADGDNQAGSSFNQNHWQDNQPGFDPSQ